MEQGPLAYVAFMPYSGTLVGLTPIKGARGSLARTLVRRLYLMRLRSRCGVCLLTTSGRHRPFYIAPRKTCRST